MLYQTLVPPEEAASLKLYKVTGPNGEPLHGGAGRWSLPNGDEPGAWWDVDTVEACRSGLHLTDAAHLPTWYPNYGDPIVWRAEVRGPLYRVGGGDKYVCGSARLLPRRARKGPSIETLRARRDAAIARSDRRVRRALAALTRDAGPGWAAYSRAAGPKALEAVSPRVRAAVDAYRAECAAAAADNRAALERYARAERRAIMPED